MVNQWLPEPPNENPLNDLRNSSENIIIMGTDTSEDDDEHYYDGYEPLPLAPDENIADDNSSDEDTIEENNIPSVNLPPIIPVEHVLVQEVWNGPAPSDIVMDQSKENEVKLAMANFTLPESSIPDWAANIPEEQWKQQLMNRIQSMKSSDNNKK